MDSILTSIKKLLGISEEYGHFDVDLIMHINSVFSILTQLGVGPSGGFVITGADETWQQFTEDRMELEQVKSYIYMKVRLLFDPPSSSVVMESINRMVSEFEWRLNVAAESAETREEA